MGGLDFLAYRIGMALRALCISTSRPIARMARGYLAAVVP